MACSGCKPLAGDGLINCLCPAHAPFHMAVCPLLLKFSYDALTI